MPKDRVEEEVEPRSLYDQRARAELALCDALEVVADDLPSIDAGRIRRISAALRAVGEAFASRLLLSRLDALEQPPAEYAALAEALELLAIEERADADIAVELADALDATADRGETPNAEALGYLIRGFFENRRRHLAWRRRAFIDRAQVLLTEEDFRKIMAPSDEVAPDLRVINLVDAE